MAAPMKLRGARINPIFLNSNLYCLSGNFNKDVPLGPLSNFLQNVPLIVSNVEILQNNITLKVEMVNGATMFVERRGRFRIQGVSVLSCRWTLRHFLELICRRGVTSVA
jgi:hypothetical protein